MKMIEQFKLITGISAASIVLGLVGFVAIKSGTFGQWQDWARQEEQKNLTAKSEINKTQRDSEVAKEAIKNKTALYDQLQISDWVADKNTPPNVNWSKVTKPTRVTLLDANNNCVGYLEPTGIPTFIYQYQGYQFNETACSAENRTVNQ